MIICITKITKNITVIITPKMIDNIISPKQIRVNISITSVSIIILVLKRPVCVSNKINIEIQNIAFSNRDCVFIEKPPLENIYKFTYLYYISYLIFCQTIFSIYPGDFIENITIL